MADTICAIATPPGAGGVGILRVSGDRVPDIAQRLLGRLPVPRQATRATVQDAAGHLVDQGLALYFPHPASYTGEHVLELHLHGNPHVLDQALRILVALGARLARPGEFTERAFLNGKIDLAQAEAVADLIGSATAQAAQAAAQALAGAFSAAVAALKERLIHVRVQLEAGLDFPDEDISPAADAQVRGQLRALADDLAGLLARAREGRLLRDGATVALLGRPNAGKSTLFNALCGHPAAIVSPLAGTTRDALREVVDIEGIPVTLIDTAGLRDATTDPIEIEGVRRAQTIAQEAQLRLLLIDDGADAAGAHPAFGKEGTTLVVYTKIDVTGRPPGPAPGGIAVSALSGDGMDALRGALSACLRGAPPAEGTFTARTRHIEALHQVRRHVEAAVSRQAESAHDLAAEDLRRAQTALGAITGEFTSEDLLGEIFSRFCIGK
ncbi:MAG: tRNA uridine-5-carboxymethylaminomethyl(34) synthesis GTPase MnmE [Gammaproteobacteria bacterium]|nr:tRNA uridine-5-carboxymethylaminomethyl(34) synthesis GTPase MnmE [Gammaproteobacteria bacterium]